jgi:hypothetical protein
MVKEILKKLSWLILHTVKERAQLKLHIRLSKELITKLNSSSTIKELITQISHMSFWVLVVGFDLQRLFWVLVVICVPCCFFLIMIGTGQQTVW